MDELRSRVSQRAKEGVSNGRDYGLNTVAIDNDRDLGQFMTPHSLANEMCSNLSKPAKEIRVVDPACGDGNLLLAVAELMIREGVDNIHEKLWGIDIDASVLAVARSRLSTRIGCPRSKLNLLNLDFLQVGSVDSPCFRLRQLANAVISNPPYGNLREYIFFDRCNRFFKRGTEMVFLMPLSFIDRVKGVKAKVVRGRPMDVTTGHVIVRHIAGERYRILPTRGLCSNRSRFRVFTGLKLYQIGEGVPSQTKEIIQNKPYSSRNPRRGWLPCLRTGDVHPFKIDLGRLYVSYGEHLAHPKELDRFTGPRVVVRRIPIWKTRTLGAAYTEDTILCAGDMLVVRDREDDKELLRGLEVYLNSAEAAIAIGRNRPSIIHRDSFPKISAKDLNTLFEFELPQEEQLRSMARRRGNAYSFETK